MFYFQLTLCFEIELISYVQTEMKALLNVSNGDILFVDTFLQLICETSGAMSSCVRTKNPKFLR